jgi:predicted glycogen debranching enzyme
MRDLVRRLTWPGKNDNLDDFLRQEWLVTNGLGGYASGTIGGIATRRFHGLLIAALPAPFGRIMMLNRLTETVRLPNGAAVPLSGEETGPDQIELTALRYLAEFRLEMGLPVWRYTIGEIVIEKQLLMPHGQNTVHLTYKLLAGREPVELELAPALYFRPHEGLVSDPLTDSYSLNVIEDRYEINWKEGFPSLRLRMIGEESTLTLGRAAIKEIYYRVEARRGYDSQGSLWSPGYLTVNLCTDRPATLVASTEPWTTVSALTPEAALAAELERRDRLLAAADPGVRQGSGAELVLAADQFIIVPAGRSEDAARARAAGDEVRTVIAGYHWFTDWGRDTMISLEGLTLVTGRAVEARWILRTFAHYVLDGLIPNLFPEGQKEGLYHTADATLWFFHALDRYLAATGDRETLRLILPTLRDIVSHHLDGTRFGIGVDRRDGLLNQGAPDYQLTWMDAKVGDWVVTPRRGKAVEINALWYNAVRLLSQWLAEEQQEAESKALELQAEKTRRSFNGRFWNARAGYLYDVVDGEQGDDPACRPNQILAVSLKYPVLDEQRWEPVLKVVTDRLLTPVGLRSLSRDHPDYRPNYDGDLRARDAAYHQGTVWAWLIGPYLDAWLKVYPQDQQALQRLLQGLERHLDDACIGSISEIFDAEEPFTPRGCAAQAWSVAEALRCRVRTQK